MIPNQWYAILESREVKPRRPIGVTRLGEKLVLWRDSRDKLSCLRDLCPHRGAALSLGHLIGGCLECPFHGFQFDSSGACRIIPADGREAPVGGSVRTQAYTVREDHGFVWLWWGDSREVLPPLCFFTDLDDGFSYSTLRDHWPVHYSRAIENQLDVVHLPFVHKTTIGRGGRSLIDGPITALEDDVLSVWVRNRVDDGTQPRRPDELPRPDGPPSLQFRFPNLWQLHIAEDFQVVLAFVPIDEGNTLLYLRGYQRTIRMPILRDIVNAVSRLSNLVILRQDKRVVVTQRPIKTSLRMGEKLIQGDRPIIVYRSRREELIRQSQPTVVQR